MHIEKYGNCESFHIRINEPRVIEHMPMSLESLNSSARYLISENNPIPDFKDGYTIWKNDNGGLFIITIDELVDIYIEHFGNLVDKLSQDDTSIDE